MLIKQISIFIENRKGRLAEITSLLAENGVNIRALSVADTTHFGILRIIVDEPEQVEKLLKSNGITASVNTVVSVKIDDQPGGLSNVLGFLADNDIAVEYIYAFVSSEKGQAYVVMRIEEDLRAQKLLTEAGYSGLEN